MANLLRLRHEKTHPASPTTEPFTGYTILVTGAAGGLGLEAAKKLACLHADKIIITARSQAKGGTARREIEEFAATHSKNTTGDGRTKTEIIPLVLDMESSASIRQFVKDLTSKITILHAAILSAGGMQSSYKATPDGWDQTYQINSLSTVYLGTLLLPLLLSTAEAAPTGPKPHLTFVSSNTAWTLSPKTFEKFRASERPLRDLNAKENYPPGMTGGTIQYSSSKLMLEYGMRHLATLPILYDANGEPKVIVHSICPGLCRSDLSRNMRTLSPVVKLASEIMMAWGARSLEDGCNIYLSGIKQDMKVHGEMWRNDRVWPAGEMVTSEDGKKMGDKIWREIVEYIESLDPGLKNYLQVK
ncbi:hypothetical protein RBB50_000928 [Rhinocladiella similis]